MLRKLIEGAIARMFLRLPGNAHCYDPQRQNRQPTAAL